MDSFLFDRIVKRKKNPAIKTVPSSRQIIGFVTKPATKKQIKLITATVMAYGSWVETWFT